MDDVYTSKEIFLWVHILSLIICSVVEDHWTLDRHQIEFFFVLCFLSFLFMDKICLFTIKYLPLLGLEPEASHIPTPTPCYLKQLGGQIEFSFKHKVIKVIYVFFFLNLKEFPDIRLDFCWPYSKKWLAVWHEIVVVKWIQCFLLYFSYFCCKNAASTY